MRIVKYWLLGLLLGSPAAFALSGNVAATDNVKAQLVSEVSAIAPGQSFWVALEFNIRDGWHTYWRNPGDSGQATKLTWSISPRQETCGRARRWCCRPKPAGWSVPMCAFPKMPICN